MKFQITYPNGKVEVVEQSDCQTVDQFVNCKFGRGAQPEAKVKLMEAEAEAEAVEEIKLTKTVKVKK